MNPQKDRLEKLLETASDMQKMDDIPDKLSSIIRECLDTELTEDELDYVSAASSLPKQNFKQFLEKLAERRNK